MTTSVYIPAAVSFTRPNDSTAYSGQTSTQPGDVIANSTTAGSVSAPSFAIPSISGSGNAEGVISLVEVQVDLGFYATIRAHLFKTTAPTVANGDNGRLAVSNFDIDKYLGYVDVPMSPGPTGGGIGVVDKANIPYTKATGDSIYVLLESAISFTPNGANVFKVRLGALRAL